MEDSLRQKRFGEMHKDIDRIDFDEKPAHQVRVSGFWMGQTEVTQEQFQRVLGRSPWSSRTYGKEGKDYAASYVSAEDGDEFCAKLTTQERAAGRLPTGAKYRLPTEAEWEYACRAGTQTKWHFGDTESQLSEYAWYSENAHDIGEKYAHQVGLKKANAWGLKDMHGNVYEWCADTYDGKLYRGRGGVTLDPLQTSGSEYRVLRGGSWIGKPGFTRSADRGRLTPTSRGINAGFRVVCVAAPSTPRAVCLCANRCRPESSGSRIR